MADIVAHFFDAYIAEMTPRSLIKKKRKKKKLGLVVKLENGLLTFQ